MTLDEALELAKRIVPIHGSDANALARYLIDALGEAAPCGWPEITIDQAGHLHSDTFGEMSPTEARAYAAMLLRAAEKAEEK